jgi:hypothetical protein
MRFGRNYPRPDFDLVKPGFFNAVGDVRRHLCKVAPPGWLGEQYWQWYSWFGKLQNMAE